MRFFDGPSDLLDGPAGRVALRRTPPHSLADAKTSEDLPEQILTAHLPRDLAQRTLSEAQILREKLERLRILKACHAPSTRACARPSASRCRLRAREGARFAAAITRAGLEMFPQRIDARAGARAHVDLRRRPLADSRGQPVRSILFSTSVTGTSAGKESRSGVPSALASIT